MFVRRQRIKKKVFEDIILNSKAVYGSCLYIKYKGNSLPYPRFAVVVPKKVERSALKRNAIKRKLRAIILKNEKAIPKSLDVVFFTKNTNKECFEDDILNIVKKLHFY